MTGGRVPRWEHEVGHPEMIEVLRTAAAGRDVTPEDCHNAVWLSSGGRCGCPAGRHRP